MGCNPLVVFLCIFVTSLQYQATHSARFPFSLVSNIFDSKEKSRASSNIPKITKVECNNNYKEKNVNIIEEKIEEFIVFEERIQEDVREEVLEIIGKRIQEDVREEGLENIGDSLKSGPKYCSSNASCALIHNETARILAIMEDLLYKYDKDADYSHSGNLNAMDKIMFPELPDLPSLPAETYVNKIDDHTARKELVKLFGFMQRYAHAFTSVILDQSLHEDSSVGDMSFAQENLKSLLKIMDFVLNSELGGSPDVTVVNELSHLDYHSVAEESIRRFRRTACLRQCVHGLRYIKELFSE
ncbi:unnamed protein product [Meganyctiphanes norvegica]|uniref:Interleukin-6 n=1 Tax=Meganyctiphanes norvegica TaxID=48144 RepID=A0AAV2S009_MEGNR